MTDKEKMSAQNINALEVDCFIISDIRSNREPDYTDKSLRQVIDIYYTFQTA